MKIKIGDVPLRIYNKVCESNCYCEECLFMTRTDSGFFKCKGVESEYQDKTIEIPDELFNKEKKERNEKMFYTN